MARTKKKLRAETMPRVTMTLDAQTLERLQQIRDENPDVMSVSAAVRHLARRKDEGRKPR